MIKIIQGDCLEKLRELSDSSVHCVVTSPPYWGLRDYKIPPVHWPEVSFSPIAGLPPITIPAAAAVLGLESDPWSFVAHIVLVFREVRRVLRPDGVCWVNFGDSYAANSKSCSAQSGLKALSDKYSPRKRARVNHKYQDNQPGVKRNIPTALKPKDLCGIPWRVALALQSDGWYLRQDIIWSKKSSMPESVTDRCCKSHEYFFLLSKSEHYFFDHESIKEPGSPDTNPRYARGRSNNHKYVDGGPGDQTIARTFKHMRKLEKPGSGTKNNTSFDEAMAIMPSTRNKRSVWTVGPEPFKEAHFATFPTDLIKPCILAGCPVRCCSACGKPWLPVYEDRGPDLDHQRACGGDLLGEYNGKSTKDYAGAKAQDASATKARILAGMRKKELTGHKPDCKCGTDAVPGTVLDPFGGSGTTGKVALELGRKAVLIELNPDYVKLIEQRTNVTPGLAL